jgi:hypothetical protein
MRCVVHIHQGQWCHNGLKHWLCGGGGVVGHAGGGGVVWAIRCRDQGGSGTVQYMRETTEGESEDLGLGARARATTSRSIH